MDGFVAMAVSMSGYLALSSVGNVTVYQVRLHLYPFLREERAEFLLVCGVWYVARSDG